MHGTGTPGAGGSLSGNITIEGTSPGGSGFRFFGSPINAAPANLFGATSGGPDGAYFIPDPTCLYSDPATPYANQMQFDESVVTYCRNQGWQMKTAGTLQNGRGYAFNVPTSSYVLSATGSPNNGTVTYSGLTNDANPTVLSNGNPVQGINMLSNPYPSPLSWDDFRASNTNLGIAAYVYNNGTWNTLIAGGPEDNIAPFQGFQVIYTGGPSTASFANTHRRAVSGISLYSNPDFGQTLTIKASGNNSIDQTFIYIDNNAQDEFNPNFDAYKMQNDAGHISVYTKIPNTTNRLYLNGIPEPTTFTTIPLGMVAAGSGNYSLDFEGISSLNSSMLIYLEDLKTGQLQLLNQNPVYNFTLEENEDEDRFLIKFYAPITFASTPAECEQSGTLIMHSPGSNWNYSIVGNNTSTSGQLLNNALFIPLNAGNYQISLTELASNYSITKSVEITGATPLTGGISATTDQVNVNEPFQIFADVAGAESYLWDFGDGTLSTQQNPIHTYTTMTTYKISLLASNSDGCKISDVHYMKAFDANVSIENTPGIDLEIALYPNPASGYVNIQYTGAGNITCSVLDVSGKFIFSNKLTFDDKTNTQILDLKHLKSGVYMLRFNSGNNTQTHKLVIF